MQFIGYFLLIVSCSAIFVRLLNILRTLHLISERLSFHINLGFFLWILGGAVFCRNSSGIYAIWCLTPSALALATPSLVRRTRSKRFELGLVQVLNVLILRLRTGYSFSEARQNLKKVRLPPEAEEVRALLAILDFPDPTRSWKTDFHLTTESLNLFRNCATEPHLALKRLQSFRRRLQIEEGLQKRISIALQQTRAQSAVTSLLFIGLVFVVFTKMDWRQHMAFIGLSTAMFSAGLVWLHILGRKIKWTI